MNFHLRTVVTLVGVALLSTLGFQGFAQDSSDIDRLEFTPGRPKTVTIYPGAGKDGEKGSTVQRGRIYWYLPYTLKNLSSKRVDYMVSVTAHSDKDVTYSDLALENVEKKVETQEQKKFHSKADRLREDKGPGLTDSYDGGETRECVAIFNPLDAEADTIVIEVRGLVNDLERENLGNDRWKITQRVLVLTYEKKGDEFFTSMDRFVFKGKKWKTETQEFHLPPL